MSPRANVRPVPQTTRPKSYGFAARAAQAALSERLQGSVNRVTTLHSHARNQRLFQIVLECSHVAHSAPSGQSTAPPPHVSAELCREYGNTRCRLSHETRRRRAGNPSTARQTMGSSATRGRGARPRHADRRRLPACPRLKRRAPLVTQPTDASSSLQSETRAGPPFGRQRRSPQALVLGGAAPARFCRERRASPAPSCCRLSGRGGRARASRSSRCRRVHSGSALVEETLLGPKAGAVMRRPAAWFRSCSCHSLRSVLKIGDLSGRRVTAEFWGRKKGARPGGMLLRCAARAVRRPHPPLRRPAAREPLSPRATSPTSRWPREPLAPCPRSVHAEPHPSARRAFYAGTLRKSYLFC